jgi:hypothetical protein
VFSHMTLMHDAACSVQTRIQPGRVKRKDEKGGERMRKDDLVGNTLGTENGSVN